MLQVIKFVQYSTYRDRLMIKNESPHGTPPALNLWLERYRIGSDGNRELISENYPVTIGEIAQHVAVSYPPPISVTWTISTPLVVAGFNPTTQAGQVIPVTPLMMSQNPLTFGFLVAGQYVVTATITSAAGTGQASNSFTVTAPTLMSLSSITDTVGISQNSAGLTLLEFGTNPGPGIIITADVRGDQYADGQLAFIQLVNGSRFAIEGMWSSHMSSNGQIVLDVGMTNTVYYQNVLQSISSGQRVNFSVTDSPAQQLPVPPADWTAFIVGENLETYQAFLMFCSNAAGAVWVPIGILDWGWGGEAANEAGNWGLGEAQNTIHPIGIVSSAFPSWSSNTAAPIQWIPGAERE